MVPQCYCCVNTRATECPTCRITDVRMLLVTVLPGQQAMQSYTVRSIGSFGLLSVYNGPYTSSLPLTIGLSAGSPYPPFTPGFCLFHDFDCHLAECVVFISRLRDAVWGQG
jgi:hypothetical protein